MNLADCGLTQEVVLEALTDKLIEQMDGRAIHLSLNAAEKIIQKKTEEIVNNELTRIVQELMKKHVQRTDLWGEKIGEPISIQQIIEDSLVNWWTAKVDNKGALVGPNAYGRHVTRAEFLMKQVIKPEVRTLASEEVSRIVNETGVEMQKQFQKELSNMILKSFR